MNPSFSCAASIDARHQRLYRHVGQEHLEYRRRCAPLRETGRVRSAVLRGYMPGDPAPTEEVWRLPNRWAPVAAGQRWMILNGGGLGHQFTGAVADLLRRSDRRAAAQAARFDDQVAAPRDMKLVFMSMVATPTSGVSRRGWRRPGEVQHAHQRAAVDVAAAVDQVGAPRSRVRAVPLPECSRNHPEQLHEGMVRPKKSVCVC